MTPKRALDVAASVVGLATVLPVGVAAAVAIRLEDNGPVFFRQERVGRGGRPFRIWKLRTMRVDAEAQGPAVTANVDDRVTKVGRMLRQWKLDELPQLLNVLAGEMSLVGPRPEVPRYVAQYTEAQRPVLDLIPGITDPASLAFRDEGALLDGVADPERVYLEEILPKKLELSLQYGRTATFVTDLKVIAETVLAAWGGAVLPSAAR